MVFTNNLTINFIRDDIILNKYNIILYKDNQSQLRSSVIILKKDNIILNKDQHQLIENCFGVEREKEESCKGGVG